MSRNIKLSKKIKKINNSKQLISKLKVHQASTSNWLRWRGPPNTYQHSTNTPKQEDCNINKKDTSQKKKS